MNEHENTQQDEIINELSISESKDPKENEIAELSKKGYVLIKANKIEEAREAFKSILDIEENNNYALVGLGDAERKQNRFSFGNNFPYGFIGFFDCNYCFLQIDDMNSVSFRKNVFFHSRIPALYLMSEVNTGFKQVFHGYYCHGYSFTSF